MNEPLVSSAMPHSETSSITLAQLSEAFLRARKNEQRRPGTIEFYRKKLRPFLSFCDSQGALTLETVDATILREYLGSLEQKGHNPGGIHAHYRAVKALLRWYEVEFDDPDFRNPMRKVKGPLVSDDPYEPVALEDVAQMAKTCGDSKDGARDKAIVFTFWDTGVRPSELTHFQLEDLDLLNGTLTVRAKTAKTNKSRLVYFARKTRQTLHRYLRFRGKRPGPLFEARSHQRLTYSGLRSMVRRRAEAARLTKVPPLHSFRRAFALSIWRATHDLVSVSRLLGHSDVKVTMRYLRSEQADLQQAHAAHSPVDTGLDLSDE